MPLFLVYFLIGLWLLISSGILGVLFWQTKKLKREVNDRNKTLLASRRIYQIILEDLEFNTVIQKIADTIPNELKFGTGVIAILDEKRGVIRRMGASRTKEAQEAIQALKLSVPFDKIEISINDPTNLMAKALRERKPYITATSHDVFSPILTQQESLRIQNIMGIKTTLVYPIFLKEKPLGVFLASTSKTQAELSEYELFVINDFVNLAGLVLQNSKLYTSLKEAKDALSNVNLEVSRMNRQLQDLDKLKDDFVSIASHELRTPMTAIRSYSWMALNKSDIPLSPKMRKYLERILISTERLINLVNDMLNISRIESGRIEIVPEPFDMLQLIKDVYTEVEPKAQEKGIKLNIVGTNTPKVFADIDKVHQVLLNIIGNALKFTPNQGIVTISFFVNGQTVEIAIQDSGVGISAEDRARLFQKFGRLDNSYVAAATSGGTGLGLYICKNLVELMKGRIWVESAGVGKGSKFIFSLPIATGEMIAQAAKLTIRPSSRDVKTLEPVAI